MKYFLTMIWTFLWVLNSTAQEFGTHWVAYPLPNDSSEVLFRHVYTTKQRPKEAYLTFTSNGKLKAYVNERNISRDCYFDTPNNPNDSHINMYTYRITNFLRPDSNVIAVWYAPGKDMPISKQLSLEYYGTDANGNDFHHQANQEWLCKILNNCYISHSQDSLPMEVFDNREYDNEWKSTELSTSADWLHPLGSYTHEKSLTTEDCSKNFPQETHDLKQVILPTADHTDSLGVHYDFGRYLNGIARITLRNVKRGCTIHYQGFTYICNGELDEQAFPRFTMQYLRTIDIYGDKNFKVSQITNIEALEYQP